MGYFAENQSFLFFVGRKSVTTSWTHRRGRNGLPPYKERRIYFAMFYLPPYPLCKLAKKMGHHLLIGLFFFVPGLNIVMLYLAASSKWPIEYERDALLDENKKLKQKEN